VAETVVLGLLKKLAVDKLLLRYGSRKSFCCDREVTKTLLKFETSPLGDGLWNLFLMFLRSKITSLSISRILFK
jgi:hypothetical protein